MVGHTEQREEGRRQKNFFTFRHLDKIKEEWEKTNIKSIT
jgi:hypothetical protein